MNRRIDRRKFVAGTMAMAGAFPMPAIAQNAPLKVGLLTVKSGPLAAGGLHAEEGITAFLGRRIRSLPAVRSNWWSPTPVATRPAPRTRPRN